MTGPEHYREAERISAAITHRGNLDEGDHRDVLMLAQLHATLALAAAVATHGEMIELRDWLIVAGKPPGGAS